MLPKIKALETFIISVSDLRQRADSFKINFRSFYCSAFSCEYLYSVSNSILNQRTHELSVRFSSEYLHSTSNSILKQRKFQFVGKGQKNSLFPPWGNLKFKENVLTFWKILTSVLHYNAFYGQNQLLL